MVLIDRSKLEAFGATCKSQDYMDGVKDVLEYIDNLPTVEVIPIECINEWIEEHHEYASRVTIAWLFVDWKKEQEKQK